MKRLDAFHLEFLYYQPGTMMNLTNRNRIELTNEQYSLRCTDNDGNVYYATHFIRLKSGKYEIIKKSSIPSALCAKSLVYMVQDCIVDEHGPLEPNLVNRFTEGHTNLKTVELEAGAFTSLTIGFFTYGEDVSASLLSEYKVLTVLLDHQRYFLCKNYANDRTFWTVKPEGDEIQPYRITGDVPTIHELQQSAIISGFLSREGHLKKQFLDPKNWALITVKSLTIIEDVESIAQ